MGSVIQTEVVKHFYTWLSRIITGSTLYELAPLISSYFSTVNVWVYRCFTQNAWMVWPNVSYVIVIHTFGFPVTAERPVGCLHGLYNCSEYQAVFQRSSKYPSCSPFWVPRYISASVQVPNLRAVLSNMVNFSVLPGTQVTRRSEYHSIFQRPSRYPSCAPFSVLQYISASFQVPSLLTVLSTTVYFSACPDTQVSRSFQYHGIFQRPSRYPTCAPFSVTRYISSSVQVPKLRAAYSTTVYFSVLPGTQVACRSQYHGIFQQPSTEL